MDIKGIFKEVMEEFLEDNWTLEMEEDNIKEMCRDYLCDHHIDIERMLSKATESHIYSIIEETYDEEIEDAVNDRVWEEI